MLRKHDVGQIESNIEIDHEKEKEISNKLWFIVLLQIEEIRISEDLHANR